MILAAFVAIYGIQTFYGEKPTWDDYCKDVIQPPYEINTSAECESLGGKWNPTYADRYAVAVPAKVPNGYCDLYYDCGQKYDAASKTYSKTLFLITVPVGVLLLIIGGALFALEAVGAGIMLGGVITLIYGAAEYWPNAGSLFRFLISLVGLILVIILAYWLNKKAEESKKFSLRNLFSKKKRKK